MNGHEWTEWTSPLTSRWGGDAKERECTRCGVMEYQHTTSMGTTNVWWVPGTTVTVADEPPCGADD